MNILNLYSGLGGNRKLWPSSHNVTAVELSGEIASVYAENFPLDTVIVGDAHEYLQAHYKEFDFIWSSPPCQSHSKMVKATRHDVARFPDLRLYEEIIFLKHFAPGSFCVENIRPYYDALIPPTKIIGRHLLWANFYIPVCFESHPSWNAPADELKAWLGIKYDGNLYYDGNHSPSQVLRNCVNPSTGLHILNSVTGNVPALQLSLAPVTLDKGT